MNNKTIVINLFAGPGTGKSTTCAQIFSELKWKNINCEMALEYAKDKVWEESFKVLDNQIYVFGKQLQRIKRLEKNVDIIITDSPLLLSLVYDKSNNENFKNLVFDIYNEFDNLNFFLKREKPYNPKGRMQDVNGAIDIDCKLLKLLTDNGLRYYNICANKTDVSLITDIALEYLNKRNLELEPF